MISFPKAISLGFSGYVNFRGRSTRAEYWWWSLFGFIASIFGVLLDVSIFGFLAGNWEAADWSLFQNLIGLALFLPGLAVTVRRLHDINKTGWWVLWFSLIFLAGGILLGVGIALFFVTFSLHTLLAVMLVMSAVILWLATIVIAIVWLCRPSDPEDNRYGGLNSTRPTETSASDPKTNRSDPPTESSTRTGYSRRREH
ncbi:MAG: DUF805 domain-containing protein [Dehalococcoidia bacterium]|nr:DUF805 domain-containing protein [Dehalococcoidia bacterium]